MWSPLKTDRIWLENIHISLAPISEADCAEQYDISVGVDIRKRSDALSFMICLTMELTPSPDAHCRYSEISIKTAGIFQLPEDTPEDFVRAVVPMNCLVILHGFARGVVAQITGLNQGGPVLLPTVNFVEALQQGKKSIKSYSDSET